MTGTRWCREEVAEMVNRWFATTTSPRQIWEDGMNQNDILKLIEIENKLYVINRADRMTREEQDEREKLEGERRRIKRQIAEG